MIAGGLESVSLIQGPPGGNKNRLINPWVQEHVPGIYHSMIQTADTVAGRYNISRQYQDEYSLQSQLRTAAAQQAGKFDDEIVPMETTMLVTDKNTNEVSKKTVKLARPSVALDVVFFPSTPLMPKMASSIGSTISRSTVSGEAPG